MENHAHTRARARRRRPACASAVARVRVPYPVRFFLNRVSRAWVTADRARFAIQTRTSATADRKPPRTVGRFLSETNRCNGSDRTVATVRSETDGFTPPPFLSFQNTQHTEAIQKRKTSSSAFRSGTSATQIQK